MIVARPQTATFFGLCNQSDPHEKNEKRINSNHKPTSTNGNIEMPAGLPESATIDRRARTNGVRIFHANLRKNNTVKISNNAVVMA